MNVDKFKDGTWMISYRLDGKPREKTRAGNIYANIKTRVAGNHRDSCYDGVKNEFKDFNTFADWCQGQHGYLNKDPDGKFWQIDKDILVEGNRVYSPSTCCFVPGKVNSLLISRPSLLGLPVGVKYSKNREKFESYCCSADGSKVYCGVYDTPQEAHRAWWEQKRVVVQEVISRYDLGSNVVDALKRQWKF